MTQEQSHLVEVMEAHLLNWRDSHKNQKLKDSALITSKLTTETYGYFKT